MSNYDLYIQKLVFLQSQRFILEEIRTLCARANREYFSLLKALNIDKLCYLSSEEIISEIADARFKHMSREIKKETEHEQNP